MPDVQAGAAGGSHTRPWAVSPAPLQMTAAKLVIDPQSIRGAYEVPTKGADRPAHVFHPQAQP